MLRKKTLVTVEDVRRINDDLVHKRDGVPLSEEDKIFFRYVKSVIGEVYSNRDSCLRRETGNERNTCRR